MRVWVTGASGLIGSSLVRALRDDGHRVERAVRRPARAPDEIHWDVERGTLDPWPAAETPEAVVHLAGESLVAGRWNSDIERRIRASRVDATESLAAWLATREPPPRHFVSASGIGFYGDRGDERLDEQSRRGEGFLAELAEAWERAASALARVGSRTAQMRIGLVLARNGGALPRLLLPARLGLGGPLGHGRQFWSWIVLEDVVRAFLHVLERPALQGPINCVAPVAVIQREFARVLGRVLGRPALLPMPAAALRLLLGRMADELLLASQRVAPERLHASGFKFRHAALEDALRAVVGGGRG
jgi:uncharacterized protein (TIGR01777 family)